MPRAARRAVGAARRAARGLTTAAAGEHPDPRAVIALGSAALVLGAAARVLLAPLMGVPAYSAAFAAVSTVAWAVARYLVLAVLTPPPPGVRGSIAVAWGRGCIAYALALAGPLRAAAFAASAVITYRSLVAAGVEARRAAGSCSIAFGVEAAALAAGWIVTNGLVVLPLLW